jgi:hypothetical protein
LLTSVTSAKVRGKRNAAGDGASAPARGSATTKSAHSCAALRRAQRCCPGTWSLELMSK